MLIVLLGLMTLGFRIHRCSAAQSLNAKTISKPTSNDKKICSTELLKYFLGFMNSVFVTDDVVYLTSDGSI